MVMDRCNKTFGEFKTCRRKNPMKVGEALQRVVSNAKQEGRLVTGITQIASFLKRYTHSVVMMCVVEVNSVENMQMKLLEAFCTEHKIKVIKVDDFSKLFKIDKERVEIKTTSTDSNYDSLVCEQTTTNCCCEHASGSCPLNGECDAVEESDATSILLTQSTHLTEEEEFVLSFYDTYRSFVSDQYPILKMASPVLAYK